MIRLEKFTDKRFDELISWIDNEETLMQFAGPAFRFPLTKEQLENSLKDEKRFVFSVIKADKNIGHCEIYLKDNSIHLGRILIGDKTQRGKGLGQKIVHALLEFGFNHFDKPMAELNVFDWNVSAIECYKRVGFTINSEKSIERKINGQTWIAINMTLDKAKWNTNKYIK